MRVLLSSCTQSREDAKDVIMLDEAFLRWTASTCPVRLLGIDGYDLSALTFDEVCTFRARERRTLLASDAVSPAPARVVVRCRTV